MLLNAAKAPEATMIRVTVLQARLVHGNLVSG